MSIDKTPEPVSVTVDYGSHKVTGLWVPWPEGHCPGCGLRGTVWMSHEADYYVGEEHICIGCGARFTMPSLSDCGDGWDKTWTTRANSCPR